MLKHPFGIYNFPVKSYDSDQNGRLTLQTLFHFLQECAWNNARMNDFGYEYLEKENTYWVLSRVLVQINEYPEWKDEISIKTWPKGADGYFALRDFLIFKDDKVIGRATTSWLILDRETKRPRRLENFNFIHQNFLNESAIDKKPDKINLNTSLAELDRRKVYPSDLDVNKHVNNATYVRWMLDAYFSNHSKLISEFEINFLSELLMHDEFTVFESYTNEELFYILKTNQDKEVCKARLIASK
ncbi:MAG: hypothetical protein A2X13_13640 [Bacteroidetes bacterium GWC2_33_15]|nr:MAG: hypothetical protein A2X10_08855 [Bacteroidetes bacterium GWA2_33_15]OFX50390.1 MAG: hypothetical protein A2X13_13640 [Bacteroidetes bacterium GWC2_33_15]OFX66692.1 MAG: hypothetical protein A2X15_08235 [Bacteroidetes bacterium GWB2_32_14]OFX69310.1 MAG: hypothetical protein A2X14_09165 [Bacteroidetes bacterium GWD2_33_33]HAN18626.1 hypothetical protein [Bacteroidales bacterium]